MRVIVYLRDNEYSMSRNQQLNSLRRSDFESGLDEAVLIEDHGTSRTGFNELVTIVRETSSVTTLIVARLDRLDSVSSTVGEFMTFLSPLLRNGVRFVSVEDNLDTDQTAAVFSAKLESAVLRAREMIRGEHIHAALKDSKDKGQRLGRPRSVSYSEVLQLRRLGHSIQAIADKLGVSRGAVQHCLKTEGSPDLSPS